MSFNYKNPISPLTSLGTISLPRTEVYGTNFSVLSTGGFMEVYSVSDLYYIVPSGSTGLIEYTGNTIPIQFQKGTGSIFSPDVLTLNSDNISSGRRRLGMLVYVIDSDQIYQYQIPNFENLWTGATSATGPGGPTVVMSDFGTTIKSNSPEGIAFISAWTANTIEGISGETSSTAVWKKLVTGGGGGGGSTITGGTFDYNTGTLSLSSSASTITITGFTDVYVTGGTFSAGTITFTNNSGGTFIVSGITGGGVSGDYLSLSGGTVTGDTIFTSGLTATTFSAATYLGLPQDIFVTGGTYSAGTATFTNNTGGTFNVTGFLTGFTDIYVTGGTFDKNTETLTLQRNDNNSVPITGFTDVFVTGGTYSNGTLFLTNNSGSTFSVPGFSTATGGTSNYYGSFSDTTNQPVSGANTATVWTYDTTEISNGIYIQDNSKIKVSNDGIYEIGYSAQIERTQQGSSDNVTIWAAINGNPVVRSSSTITLGNNNVYSLPFVSYIFDLYAGDYVEFYFSSPDANVQLTTLSGLTSPTRPVSPSVIIVAKAIGNAVLNTSGDSFVTGFSLNNDILSLSQNRVGIYSGFSVNLPYLNTTGGTINGDLSVSGNVSASTYYGYGGYLTGISRGGGGGAGGQLYYFNISNTQSPYYEFSTTATTASEQTISATTGASQTAYVGGFMTPSTLPNITNFPAGILSFYLHCYDGNTNHNFDVYCELYKRTTGGTETLLFTSDPVAVIGNTPEMVITDGYFSGGTLNISDRLVVKIYATNISNQTRTFYFVSEGSQHYSFALTTIPTFTDTYVTGFTYSDNTLTIKQNNSQPDLTATLNTFTGITATTISATTYQNLPTDIRVTGGTKSGSVITFTNNTGGTFNVTGITDTFVTGGTYSNGTATFTNNTGGTFNVSGFYAGATDVFVTGATYNDANQFTFTNNTGGTFNVSFNVLTGLTATTISATTINATTISGGTLYGDGQNITNVNWNLGLAFSIANGNYYT